MVLMRARFGRWLSRDEQGAIAIVTAFLMVALVLGAALVVDLGNARDVRRQSQNAADASSLAGANMLYPATGVCQSGAQPCVDDAVAEAKLYALKNFQVSASDWNTCTAPAGQALAFVPAGGTSCISFSSDFTQVRVYVPTRTVPTFFGGIAGRSSIPVGSSAEAQLGKAVTCSLCFLGGVDPINGDLTVHGGNIAVNMNAKAGPNSLWNAQNIGVAGTVSGGNFTPPATAIPHFGDPLLNSLTLPMSATTLSTLSAKTDPCSATATGGPGLYGAFSVPKDTCTLQPGLYVISGPWDMKNNSLLAGTGVTLYVRNPSGYLDFKNGNVAITAPLTAPLTGVPAGFAIIYDRNNTNNLYLQGNGVTSIAGIVYAPASSLVFNGNSCFGFSGGPIVLNNAVTNGNKSCITVSNAVDTTVGRALLHLNK